MPGPPVLAITSELPWPLDSGGRLRSFHLLRAVAAECDFRLVCPVESGREADVAELIGRGVRVVPAAVGRRTPWGEATRLARARLRGDAYVMYRRHDRPALRRAWETEWRREPAAVAYLDHLDAALFAGEPRRAGAPVVLDLHNSYATLARRTAAEQRHPLKRWFLAGEARRLERAERKAVGGADALFAVSGAEAELFRSYGAGRVQVVPNGVDAAALALLPAGRPLDPPVLLYLGAMSWGPNAAAARFLAEDVLPALRTTHPAASLLVVGKNPGPDVQRLGRLPGVTVTGGVPEVAPYLARAGVLAVPLESGGGTRLKILEAFAAGLPVVSTPVGAEGIGATPGVHYTSAERGDFAAALVAVVARAAEAAEQAAAARQWVAERYDWKSVGLAAAIIVRELATTGTTAPARR